jgi:hypothetical protein
VTQGEKIIKDAKASAATVEELMALASPYSPAVALARIIAEREGHGPSAFLVAMLISIGAHAWKQGEMHGDAVAKAMRMAAPLFEGRDPTLATEENDL